MEYTIGSWIVGLYLSHFIPLDLIYRYNINTNIRQCNNLNFGHYDLDLIDRIQICMHKLFNVVIFKDHINLSMVKTDPDFVSVGIGLLHYSLNYIKTRVSDNRLYLAFDSLLRR